MISNCFGVRVVFKDKIVSIPQLGWGDFKHQHIRARAPVGRVSIPQLGWGDFKLEKLMGGEIATLVVSIPQLGWGDFKPAGGAIVWRRYAFQSLNWDGVISNGITPLSRAAAWLFQSLNWDGVISNRSRRALILPHFMGKNRPKTR